MIAAVAGKCPCRNASGTVASRFSSSAVEPSEVAGPAGVDDRLHEGNETEQQRGDQRPVGCGHQPRHSMLGPLPHGPNQASKRRRGGRSWLWGLAHAANCHLSAGQRVTAGKEIRSPPGGDDGMASPMAGCAKMARPRDAPLRPGFYRRGHGRNHRGGRPHQTAGAITAVDRLSFTVAPGRVTGLVGPNGAGKSTTMRLLLGLDRPDAGSARVNGKSCRKLRQPGQRRGRRRRESDPPGRRLRLPAAWLAHTNDLPRQRVDEVLSQVGLTAVAHRRTGGVLARHGAGGWGSPPRCSAIHRCCCSMSPSTA